MKKFLLANIFLCFSFVLFAQIPRTYMGLELGKSTDAEVIRKLLSDGFDIQTIDSIDAVSFSKAEAVSFSKDTIIDDIPMKTGLAAFVENKLVFFIFMDTCNVQNNCEEWQDKIITLKKRYDHLGVESIDMGVLFAISKQIPPVEAETWFRSNDGLSVISVMGATVGIWAVVDSELLMNSFMNNLTKLLGPNYDEANKVTGIAGCKFNIPAKEAISYFNKRFDKYYIDKDPHSARWSNVSFGGMDFDYFTIYFSYDEQRDEYIFVSASAQSYFETYELEIAKMTYEGIKANYENKYTNGNTIEDVNEEMKIVSTYGMIEDTTPPIWIYLYKGPSKGGDMFYYVIVDYFQERRSDIYLDEI